ncbi:endonuclease domain-containing protein [Magnetovirga frankeli]|uniref:endonuclease domain-containing protein n=1 Tax=Magnetovirga frankeli TaxID=947516 RepID=UPI003D339AC1
MRHAATDAEQKLWQRLRNRALGGYKFRRQVPVGPYILDFLCKELKLVIELDGSQHMEQQAYDDARSRYLEMQGLKVLRYWDNDTLQQTESVLEAILFQCQELASNSRSFAPPHPQPFSPRGEGSRSDAPVAKSDPLAPRPFGESRTEIQQPESIAPRPFGESRTEIQQPESIAPRPFGEPGTEVQQPESIAPLPFGEPGTEVQQPESIAPLPFGERGWGEGVRP